MNLGVIQTSLLFTVLRWEAWSRLILVSYIYIDLLYTTNVLIQIFLIVYIASHAPDGCKLLICDRTFASLDSAACRLMGGWAAFGLKWVCLWSTDIISDYQSVLNHKVIMQDSAGLLLRDIM
jgi:hypothetical protein